MAEDEPFRGLEEGLLNVREHQQQLSGAVAGGQLWMEEGVAERAAGICDRAVVELDEWLTTANVLTRQLPFGENEDGNASANAYARAGANYIEVMRGARDHYQAMAQTYRAAGRTMEQTDQDAAQPFQQGMA